MKNFKRISSVVLAIVMVFAMMVPAMAEDVYTITVTNANLGETYNAYKVFDVKYVDNPDPDDQIKDDPHSYTIAASSPFVAALTNYPAGDPWFTFTPSASNDEVLVVTKNAAYTDAAALAAYLQEYVATNSITPTQSITEGNQDGSDGKIVDTADGSVTFTGLEAGYYFVDTTTGTLCIVNTTNPSVSVNDKNEDPTITKTVDEAYAEIGDEVTFTITVNAKEGAEKYVVHDTLDAGLTFKPDTLAIAGLTKNVEYELVTAPAENHCTFEIVFKQDYLDEIGEAGETIVITYKATVDGTLATTNTKEYQNKATLTWGNNSETEVATTTTSMFELTILKTDGTKALTGAIFELYDDTNTVVDLVKESDGVYHVANAAEITAGGEALTTEIAVDANGKATVLGLDGNTTYELEEIVAPTGYNILTERENASIETADKTVTVVNQSGVELPETGGIGTTIFYLVGGLMVTGAFVLLITKKRMGNRA